MIQSKFAALLLATATVGAGPVLFLPSAAHAQAEVEVSFDFFNESLSPYGEWIEVGDYGLCWRPSDIDTDWAPYTDGYWSYTDAGWTWVSYEDFGSIVYHYGRWVNVEDEGWCWVPDYEWGPAWVSWRNSDEHIGWAPLPPEARWEPTVGFSVWVDNSYDIGPSYYNFCAVEDFGAPVIREVILPRPRNLFVIERTVNITNITVNNFIGVPFCGGPRYDVISHRVRRPIPALKLVRETNITNIYNNTVINKTVIKNGNRRVRAIHAAQQGNQLIVPAPRVKRVANVRTALPHVKPKRTIPAAKVRKGWNLVQDPEQRTRLKRKFAEETKGRRPDTAPARAIETAELKPVPAKADPKAPSPVNTGRRADRDGRNGRDDRPDRPDRTERAAQRGQVMPPAVVPNTPTAKANDDKPGKRDRDNDNDRKERREKAGMAAGERPPLKAFNGGNAPDAPGRDKDRKEKEQIARAAEVQEQFRKRQREQAEAGRRNNDKPGKMNDARERQRGPDRPAPAEIRREQQPRAAQPDRQRDAMKERQREARREQQESMARQQQKLQSQAAEQRRQQAQSEAAAQARREQMRDMQRQQAVRQQQSNAQQERAKAMRQQQMQMQRAQQTQRQQMQAQRPGGGGGGRKDRDGGGERNRGREGRRDKKD